MYNIYYCAIYILYSYLPDLTLGFPSSDKPLGSPGDYFPRLGKFPLSRNSILRVTGKDWDDDQGKEVY